MWPSVEPGGAGPVRAATTPWCGPSCAAFGRCWMQWNRCCRCSRSARRRGLEGAQAGGLPGHPLSSHVGAFQIRFGQGRQYTGRPPAGRTAGPFASSCCLDWCCCGYCSKAGASPDTIAWKYQAALRWPALRLQRWAKKPHTRARVRGLGGHQVPCAVQGRTAISFFTALTPFTPRAMVSAVVFSLAFLAKPDSITVPLSVSTLMAAASTALVLDKSTLDGSRDGPRRPRRRPRFVGRG